MINSTRKRKFMEDLLKQVEAEVREELKQELKQEYRNSILKKKKPSNRFQVLQIPDQLVKRKSFSHIKIDPKEQFRMSTYNRRKFILGELCPENHNWQKTGKSLRYKSNHKCLLCQQNYNKKRGEIKSIINSPGEYYTHSQMKRLEVLLDIDTKHRYLGDLCPKNHDYKNTGLTLRNKGSKKCNICTKIHNDRYLKRKK